MRLGLRLCLSCLVLIGLVVLVTARADAQALPLNHGVITAALVSTSSDQALPGTTVVTSPDVGARWSPLMWSLYGTTAAMQGLDVSSTLAAIREGGRETDPLVSWATSNRPAFIGLKAGIAAATILGAHNLSRHHKISAALVLIGINSAYGMLVARNYAAVREMAH